MSELREVPPKTPILDAAEASGGRVGLIARILRPFKAIGERIRRRRQQRHIDRTYHDALRVGTPELDDTP